MKKIKNQVKSKRFIKKNQWKTIFNFESNLDFKDFFP